MPSIVDNRKRRGRGRPPTGIGKPVGLRLYPELEQKVDAWASKQPDQPGRPEAIRRLLEIALKTQAKSKRMAKYQKRRRRQWKSDRSRTSAITATRSKRSKDECTRNATRRRPIGRTARCSRRRPGGTGPDEGVANERAALSA